MIIVFRLFDGEAPTAQLVEGATRVRVIERVR
jgi:hypothetical protein